MPITSAQRGAMGSAYAAKKAGKGKPRKTPSGVWKMSAGQLKEMLESGLRKKKPSKKALMYEIARGS